MNVVNEEIKGSAKAQQAVLDEEVRQSDYAKMRDHFAKQPKRVVRIRKEVGDGWVQVNGYTFVIQAGVKVEVPEQVAQMLEDGGYI